MISIKGQIRATVTSSFYFHGSYLISLSKPHSFTLTEVLALPEKVTAETQRTKFSREIKQMSDFTLRDENGQRK